MLLHGQTHVGRPPSPCSSVRATTRDIQQPHHRRSSPRAPPSPCSRETHSVYVLCVLCVCMYCVNLCAHVYVCIVYICVCACYPPWMYVRCVCVCTCYVSVYACMCVLSMDVSLCPSFILSLYLYLSISIFLSLSKLCKSDQESLFSLVMQSRLRFGFSCRPRFVFAECRHTRRFENPN